MFWTISACLCLAQLPAVETAYDRVFLDANCRSFGLAVEYAVHRLGMDLDAFFEAFLTSGIAPFVEDGGWDICDGGCPGWALARKILGDAPREKAPDPGWRSGRTREYRTGWALAWYQWKKAEPFADILGDVLASEIVGMELPYRKADLTGFGDALDAIRARRRCQNEN